MNEPVVAHMLAGLSGLQQHGPCVGPASRLCVSHCALCLYRLQLWSRRDSRAPRRSVAADTGRMLYTCRGSPQHSIATSPDSSRHRQPQQPQHPLVRLAFAWQRFAPGPKRAGPAAVVSSPRAASRTMVHGLPRDTARPLKRLARLTAGENEDSATDPQLPGGSCRTAHERPGGAAERVRQHDSEHFQQAAAQAVSGGRRHASATLWTTSCSAARPRPCPLGADTIASPWSRRFKASRAAPARVSMRSAPFAAIIPGDSVVEQVVVSGLDSFL